MRPMLAFRQLASDPIRLAVAVLGVAFAVVLMLMQLGFRSAMLTSAVRYHERLAYDLVLVSPKTIFIGLTHPFPRVRLYQARGVAGVEEVTPVYAQQQRWENPWRHTTRNVLVVGIDPSRPVLVTPGAVDQLDRVREEDTVLFDTGSRPECGPVGEHFAAGERITTEIGDRTVEVVGLYELGSSFGVDGNVLTSEENFLRIFPGRPAGAIDLGLIRLADGVEPEAVRDYLATILEHDVEVLTRDDFVAREIGYWTGNTPIGYVFGFGLVMGLVVGGIIVYQILFADVSDHLAEYATLKAIGFSNAAVSGVVLRQALLLSVLGFLPGVAASLALYRMASLAIRMPLSMTRERLAGVLVMTVVMCAVAALLAVRKVRDADPAEVF